MHPRSGRLVYRSDNMRAASISALRSQVCLCVRSNAKCVAGARLLRSIEFLNIKSANLFTIQAHGALRLTNRLPSANHLLIQAKVHLFTSTNCTCASARLFASRIHRTMRASVISLQNYSFTQKHATASWHLLSHDSPGTYEFHFVSLSSRSSRYNSRSKTYKRAGTRSATTLPTLCTGW